MGAVGLWRVTQYASRHTLWAGGFGRAGQVWGRRIDGIPVLEHEPGKPTPGLTLKGLNEATSSLNPSTGEV